MSKPAYLGLLLVVTLNPACQDDETVAEPGGDPTPGATPVDVDDDVNASESDPNLADPDVWRCDGDGEFGVSVAARGLEALEGARVWLSAVEPDPGTPEDAEVVVLLGGRVEGGAFRLACDRGLRTNYAYPSLAVVVDRDGDGTCSPADQVFRLQMYGWADAQEYGLTADAVETPWPMEDAWQPASEIQPAWDVDVCSYHFAAL